MGTDDKQQGAEFQPNNLADSDGQDNIRLPGRLASARLDVEENAERLGSETVTHLAPRTVAIVHDWLTEPGGAERVLEQMLLLFPNADVFTVCDFLSAKHRAFLQGKKPKTTFIQHLPFARSRYRSYLPLMAIAIEQFDLSAYDIVLSSSYAVAKGVLTGPEQLHISYVHTPIRYAWHLQFQYLRGDNLAAGIKSLLARLTLHYLRIWDVRSAVSVDIFLANSNYVARQIQKLYGRDSQVLHPPVDVQSLLYKDTKQDFYLTASRLVPYKKIDLIVRAFAKMPDKQLFVIGDGPQRRQVEEAAAGHPNIVILGYQPNDVLHRLMADAKAFIFAAREDFGITPVEAQACGTPVIAFGKGGVLETICGLNHPVPTGVFYQEQTEFSLIEAVNAFEAERYRISSAACRANAERFSTAHFREGLDSIVRNTTLEDGIIMTGGETQKQRSQTVPKLVNFS